MINRETIESFGFHKTGEDVERLIFQSEIDDKSWWELTWDWDGDKPSRWNIMIEYWYDNLNNRSDCFTRFAGTIKNKSELEQVLKTGRL